GRAVGAQKALFRAIDEWAKKVGFDPERVKERVREMLREKYGVESCSQLSVEQWTEAAAKRAELIRMLEKQYI
ncbi:MAG: hypothetical protein K6U74_14230, partial [Firmicutes bacterium]|nr:hypothetical protein [Bacillota bacterium]